MTSYPNWLANSTNTVWKHRHNPRVIVAIVKTEMSPYGRFNIFHSHPGPNGTAVIQEYETARTMAGARERAEKHLRHWTLSENWTKDKDFGRMGKRAT
jgi:hypothetical protein